MKTASKVYYCVSHFCLMSAPTCQSRFLSPYAPVALSLMLLLFHWFGLQKTFYKWRGAGIPESSLSCGVDEADESLLNAYTAAVSEILPGYDCRGCWRRFCAVLVQHKDLLYVYRWITPLKNSHCFIYLNLCVFIYLIYLYLHKEAFKIYIKMKKTCKNTEGFIKNK